ncbi:peptidoglycan-associated lipoprotein Pal [Trichlorobacter ammonificans]|uniref:Peptidoglycan-associated lipoprotein n=2 Tax=Trichlorobacter ammonificans TaxID=2916410 RepID=A0ABM9D4G3_9BACT|nr:peptidoglycan-associated lipoprotein Pal [Trichlorobacter ammonificans]CAH2030137.1 Peptidoglycan-associated protein [Trichlorobacter ammonificans]
MRNGFRGMVVALGVVALMAAGCAKDEVVKKDEPVVQQQTVAPQPAPQPVPQPEPPKPEPPKAEPKMEEGTGAKASEAISLETVYFDFDKSDLRKDTLDVLAKNAEALLKKDASAKIKIEGHCDERGTDEYNLALGDRRAKSAASHLIKLGVAADRISTISYGKEKPAVQGHDEAAWSKNRRAEFVIVK